jgi:triacylglycerol lipase
MPLDPQFAINVIYPAASAAYLIQTVPNPMLPAGYTLVKAIEANMQEAAPAMAAAIAQNQTAHLKIVHAMLADSNIFGLVAWNAATQTALVAFRGTQTVKDWIDDVDALPVPYIAVPGAGLVHLGFQLVYEHVRKNTGQILANNCPGAQRILVTGHSLGGALAVLGAYDIAKNIGKTTEVYTLAGPRAGAPDFAGNFNAQIKTCERVVNFMDVVPQVPLPPLYKHVGEEIDIRGGFRPLDPAYAHALTTYLAGLHKLPLLQAAAPK